MRYLMLLCCLTGCCARMGEDCAVRPTSSYGGFEIVMACDGTACNFSDGCFLPFVHEGAEVVLPAGSCDVERDPGYVVHFSWPEARGLYDNGCSELITTMAYSHVGGSGSNEVVFRGRLLGGPGQI